ncbi:hypothetical protein SRABI27_01343 [Pedobacter sp. Bi27]|uniref:DUF2306 domain-containing protein n=2 Tax=Pedobacter TaxID=84567 RepID=UPI001DBACE15|nr:MULTISPECIES: DUF2306 domain-containing protein [unclassified Pedobacter]CAH0160327.1 hypothetical protein SRABI36_01002 [Pedobacter sp. Bi36]CAH0184577.1 hypothetical protein SRABI27_01343 [Pedobacter sp. Bi27]CAH0216167.1 hypothetical protein SRABI126_02093 [Pedobacter sp. Bi126]
MVKKGLWILFATFALLIGLYPAIYFLMDRKFGLLNSKSVDLLTNTFWNIGFYMHIIFGGIALFIGWTQFSPKMRNRRMALHRKLGKVYVVAVLLSALAGIYIGFFATGGWVSSAGFICLGIVWLYTTLKAYLHIKSAEIEKHQKMMVYSYAACFAAVTLRIWLPLLTMVYGDFSKAYLVVAWLCWIPNLIVAYLITRRTANQ